MTMNIEYLPEVEARFDEYFARVRGTLDWELVLPKFFPKTAFKKNARGFRMNCPVHNEKTPSMQFFKGRSSFNCFGCGESGNIFVFIAHMIDGDMTAVMWFINKHFHIPLPFTKREWRQIQRQRTDFIHEEFNWNSRIYYADYVWPFYEVIDSEEEDVWYHIGNLSDQSPATDAVIDGSTPEVKCTFKMKKLFIVRHAPYNDNGKISIRGYQKIIELAPRLRGAIPESYKILILTSPVSRAVDTANVLSEYLKVSFNENETFDSCNTFNTMSAFQAILERADDAEAIILVTHLEYCEYLPVTVAKEIMNQKIPSCNTNKGKAWVCDLEKNTVEKLS